MHQFNGHLVAGDKRPYDTWTFLVVPLKIAQACGGGARLPIAGSIGGVRFRGNLTRGRDGSYRVPVTRAFLARAGVERGQLVPVRMGRDADAHRVDLPEELRAALELDAAASALFETFTATHRRAWASWIGEAKQAETRVRRAARAVAGIRQRGWPA